MLIILHLKGPNLLIMMNNHLVLEKIKNNLKHEWGVEGEILCLYDDLNIE